MSELERELPVLARLPNGARLDRVDRHALGPAGVEDESRLLEILIGIDVKARAPEEAAAQVLRRVELEGRRRGARDRRQRTLTEDVQQAEDRHDRDQGENDASDERSMTARIVEIAVALE